MIIGKRKMLSDVNMLSGKILPELLKFAVPVILTGVLQQLYNTADNIVVGQFGGEIALASVGATTSIISMLVTVFINIFVGTNILVARSKGAEDNEMLKKIVSTTYVIALVLGFALMITGEILAEYMLRWTNCPEEVIPGALKYLRIYFIGIPASMLTNFGASVIRNLGDSKTPFIFLSLSGIANVVLNILLVLIFGDPVASVAIATVAAMFISAALFVIYMCRLEGPCKLNLFRFRFYSNVFIKTIKYGIPSIISSVSFSFTNVIIQPAINDYGPVGISGSTAASSIEAYLYAINNYFMAAVVAFVGQNIGAGNRERVSKVLKTAYLTVISLMAVYTVLIIGLGRELLWIFLPGNTEAIEFAQFRMAIIMSAAMVNGIMNVNSGALQAYGYTSVQMISNLVGVCAFRLFWMEFIYPLDKTPFMLWICYPISWVATAAIIFTIVMIITYKYKHNIGLKKLNRGI